MKTDKKQDTSSSFIDSIAEIASLDDEIAAIRKERKHLKGKIKYLECCRAGDLCESLESAEQMLTERYRGIALEKYATYYEVPFVVKNKMYLAFITVGLKCDDPLTTESTFTREEIYSF